jgi:hypothetical protein
MEGRCERHQFDQAADRCGRCGGEFCSTCVVYAFGPKKPPFCLPCAVAAAGVRSGAGSAPPLSRRERKRLAKERVATVRAAAEAAPPAPEPYDMGWMTKLESSPS